MNAHRLFVVLFVIGISVTLRGQSTQWLNYTSGRMITAFAEESNYVWVGTAGGAVQIDKWTTVPVFFNQGNSELPDNHITALAIDASGVKWFATNYGLARYDGVQWMVFDTSNSALPSNAINCLQIDNTGAIWAGCSNGLAKYDGVSWTAYIIPTPPLPGPAYPWNLVSHIEFSATGVAWMGVAAGLVSFDGTNWQHYNNLNSGLPVGGVVDIAIDSSDHKWLAMSGGLVEYDNNSWTIYTSANSGLPDDYLIEVELEGNTKWITTQGVNGGLTAFSSSGWVTYNSSNSILPGPVFVLHVSSNGEKWMGTLQNSVYVYGNAGWSTRVASNSSLTTNNNPGLDCSFSNRMWIADDGYMNTHSVSTYAAHQWSSYPQTSGTKWTHVQNDSAVWFNRYQGVMLVRGSTSTVFTTANSGLPDNQVWDAASDHSGNIWFWTDNGIAKYDGSTWTAFTPSNSSLPFAQYNDGVFDGQDTLWLVSPGNGIVKFDGINSTIYDSNNSPLADNNVSQITIDSSGSLWISSPGVLSRMNASGWTQYDTSNSPLELDHIWNIEADAAGRIWIGTHSQGMYILDGATWTHFTMANSGVPHFAVYHFAFDTLGNTWMGTGGGGVGVYNANGIVMGMEDPGAVPVPSCNIFPDPMTEHCSIELGRNAENAQLLLYDATGQIVLRKTINGTRAEITRQEISAGLYICHVVENGVVICTSKLVVL